MNKYVPGIGPLGAKLVILGEAPSYEEVDAGKPFVGASGRELTRICKDAGISRDNCWVTNVCKYFVPPAAMSGPKKSFLLRASEVGINLDEQIAELRSELNTINPNCILILGGTALWALTGHLKIQEWRGSIILGMGFKCVATFHPAHLIHQGKGEIKGYWNRQVMIFDFKRAKEQSQFKDLRLPQRSLNVCQNSGQLHDFIQRHSTYNNPSIDIEAHPNGSCIPICVGIAFNKSEGITVPLWNVDGISNIPTADLASMWRLLAHVLYQDVIGANFGYDRDKIKRLGFLVKGLKSDTMLKAFTISPELPKNLAFNTSLYTEEPFYKNEGMYEGSIQDLLIGCARDACVTKEVDLAMDHDIDAEGLRPYYENFVLKLHDLYSYIESEGLKVDESIREKLIEKYIYWDERLRYDLFAASGEYINTSSPKQVSKLMYDKWNIPEHKGTGEEVITKLLAGTVKDLNKRKGLEIILEDRRVKRTISSLLLAPSDFDGRMKTSFFICLETGRSSTQQLEAPIRPTIEVKEDGKKKKKAIGLAFQTITKHGDIGPEVRTMLVADEGEIFLQADSSQAEARVVFLLAEDYEALEDIDKRDYHAFTASWFFGGTEDDYSKKVLGYEHPIRFAGKTLRHAGHLGMGKSRAATELNTQARKYKIDIRIAEDDAEKALNVFHTRQPKIKGVFQSDVIKCLEKNRKLAAPVPYGVDASIGGIREFYERWNDELFRQAFSYIPQRTVSENTKSAALRIRNMATWIRILGESHDALLFSVPNERKQEAAIIIKTEFERPIDFSTCSIQRGKLSIPCEIEEGMNYKDFKKLKIEGLV